MHNVLLKTSDGLETFFLRHRLSENAGDNMTVEERREKGSRIYQAVSDEVERLYQANRLSAKRVFATRSHRNVAHQHTGARCTILEIVGCAWM